MKLSIVNESIEKIDVNGLPTLWYEDEAGNKLKCDLKNPYDVPKGAVYQYSCFPTMLRTSCLKLTDNGSEHVATFESSWPEDLAINMVKSGDYTLSQAIMIAGKSCERCLNSLLYKYKCNDGYPEFSDEWKKCNTKCDFCRSIDSSKL